MVILVTGGRKYDNRAAVFHILDLIHQKYGIDLIIAGGATGADSLAEEWSDSRGVAKLIMRAKWKLHGRSAGPIRNRAMLQASPDAVVGFPGNDGTADMTGIAREVGTPVWEPFKQP